jgi:hypothetical protein
VGQPEWWSRDAGHAGACERIAARVIDRLMAEAPSPASGRGDAPSSRRMRETCYEVHTMAKTQTKRLVVCIDNEGYGASLEKRKIYVALRDATGEQRGLIRIVDESGDDYLYPKSFFRPIALPSSIKKAVLAAA